MKIINLAYKATNCYLVQANCGWLMVDAGWPDTLSQMLHLLKQKDIQVSDIKYLLVTHFHPDHAGLVENFKELGASLVLHEDQMVFVDKLNNFFKKNPKVNFKDIVLGNNIVVSSAESREFLKTIGVAGVMVKTPGHSEDSISLILDEGCAFTGDLPLYSLMEAYNDQKLKDSWELIQNYKVKKIYPAHGSPYTL
jgi:glyoxylase-like metal-dependent hydrolase (beta-lactamase superfamily II)